MAMIKNVHSGMDPGAEAPPLLEDYTCDVLWCVYPFPQEALCSLFLWEVAGHTPSFTFPLPFLPLALSGKLHCDTKSSHSGNNQ